MKVVTVSGMAEVSFAAWDKLRRSKKLPGLIPERVMCILVAKGEYCSYLIKGEEQR